MTDALKATDFDLALDVGLNFAAKVTFDGDVLVNPTTKLVDFFVGQVANTRVRTDVEIGAHALCSRLADAKDVGERNLQPLLAGNVNSRNTGHAVSLFSSQP